MDIYKTYQHNPPHWFVSNAIYMVTGSTLSKEHLLGAEEKRANFCETLIERAKVLGWVLHAWAVMKNHYHFIAQSPENALSLKLLVQVFIQSRQNLLIRWITRLEEEFGTTIVIPACRRSPRIMHD